MVLWFTPIFNLGEGDEIGVFKVLMLVYNLNIHRNVRVITRGALVNCPLLNIY